MCGIVYIRKENKPAGQTAWKFFDNQRARGTDGFGFIALQDGQVMNYVRKQNEKDIKKELNKSDANEILFHHRIPTSVLNLEETAHPIKVSAPSLVHDYYVIHNGIITNCNTLKTEHEKRGLKYQTLVTMQYLTQNKVYTSGSVKFNDSESLAIELALVFEGKKKEISANGDNAFICLQTDKTGRAINLFFGRNSGNPLKMEKLDKFLAISSTGQGKLIDPHKLYAYNYVTKEIKISDMKFGDDNLSSFVSWEDYPYELGYKSRKSVEIDENDIEDSPRLFNDLLIERVELEEEIRAARKVDNYDELQQLEYELEFLNQEIESYGLLQSKSIGTHSI